MQLDRDLDDVVSSSATFLATVDFPEPLPPAIPIMSGLSMLMQSYGDGVWNALCRPCSPINCLLRKTAANLR